MKYSFAYSGQWEGYKKFNKFRRLLNLVRKVPEYELKNCSVILNSGNFKWVGCFYKLKNGKINIKIK